MAPKTTFFGRQEANRCPDLAGNLFPETICRIVEPKQSRNHDGEVDAAPALAQPVNVPEVQPERELVDDQRRADSKDRRQPWVKPFRPQRDAQEADEQEDHDAPYEVMDVETASGHDVADREKAIADAEGQRAQENEGCDEGHPHTQR